MKRKWSIQTVNFNLDCQLQLRLFIFMVTMIIVRDWSWLLSFLTWTSLVFFGGQKAWHVVLTRHLLLKAERRPIPWHTNAVAIWNSPNWAYVGSPSWLPAGIQAYKVQPNKGVHHHVVRLLQLHLGFFIARMAMIAWGQLRDLLSNTNLLFCFATRKVVIASWKIYIHISYIDRYIIYTSDVICRFSFLGGLKIWRIDFELHSFGTWRCHLGSLVNYLQVFVGKMLKFIGGKGALKDTLLGMRE